jgi:hypothetical protein
MSDHNNKQLAKSNNQLTLSQPTSIGVRATKQEVDIYLAKEGKTLQHFKNKDMNDLKNVVVKWVYMLGLTGKVSEHDIVANTQIIADLFPNITIRQIELAIKFSMQGTLDVDAETYGTFSPLYISRIIKAYLTYSSSKIKEINWRKMSMEKMETKELQEPYETRLISRKKLVKTYIAQVTTRNTYVGDFNHVMWELFKSLGLLNPKTLPLDEADKWAENKAILESQTTDAKRFSKMTQEQRDKEIEKVKKMYGRYFILRKLLLEMKDPLAWVDSLDDKILLPK